ncbi:MAG: tRNA (adenosine(37)-N6)-dimethylallyltransferase MiaA [Desulfuromonadales bacterium]|nr:tRNA (adenosine(37)-N6)-dimethylallyltransferase MiaA [Desulfuromonadales bacterium]
MILDSTANTFNLFTILGPTASGKTRLGVQLARALDGEIISADSRQVYRGMDIGSGKDSDEYEEIPYHLIDIVAAGSEFSVFDFQQRFYQAFAEIRARGRLPLLVGGTGLYLEAALRGYRLVPAPPNRALRDELAALDDAQLAARLHELRPQQHNSTDLVERERLIRAIEIALAEQGAAEHLPAPPLINPLIIGVHWDRKLLRERITRRLSVRLNGGMIEEVAALHAAGVPWERLEFYGLEYRFVAQYLQGQLNRNDLFQKLNSAIHQFAKRQETWFRRMEKQGATIHWVAGAGDPLAAALAVVESLR